MSSTYEVRQYNISKIIEFVGYYDTPKEVYKLLTREELRDPHCVYENLSKKDKYIGVDVCDLIERIDEELFVCIKVKINVETKKEKIVNYWFE